MPSAAEQRFDARALFRTLDSAAEFPDLATGTHLRLGHFGWRRRLVVRGYGGDPVANLASQEFYVDVCRKRDDGPGWRLLGEPLKAPHHQVLAGILSVLRSASKCGTSYYPPNTMGYTT